MMDQQHSRKYEARLRSPEWRVFRMTIMAQRGCYCEECGSAREVQLHHVCHQLEHGILDARPSRPEERLPSTTPSAIPARHHIVRRAPYRAIKGKRGKRGKRG